MRHTAIVAALLVVASLTPSPALAHTDAELSAWLVEWSAQEITPGTLDEWLDMAERHPCRLIPCPPEASPTIKASIFRADPIPVAPGLFAPAVERWRALVASYFPPETVERMLRVLRCESGGDPSIANREGSGALGLLQIMPFWQKTYPGDYTDPETNIRIARLIWDRQGWGAWVCKG
jgi:hypothetical protein